eukprot:333506-Alexandrium_andersonii.AAC.1
MERRFAASVTRSKSLSTARCLRARLCQAGSGAASEDVATLVGGALGWPVPRHGVWAVHCGVARSS